MGTSRFFDGTRPGGNRRGAASELMRIEIQKKGKLPAAFRYKQIFKQKLRENQEKAQQKGPSKFSLPGMMQADKRKMSKMAEQMIRQVAMKKARKEAKALRKMVIVQPRNFSNGSLNKKGQIYDIAGNMIGQVNLKNGSMAAGNGWSLGKYKPKSVMTNMVIQDAINKYSPYYINLRKMQAMQAGGQGDYGVWGPQGNDVVQVHGASRQQHADMFGHKPEEATYNNSFGADAGGPRQNIGVTAWGAASDNVWGTFADNAWGQSMDNVWGTNSSDVWGGIGGNPWGNHAKTVRIWGTGNGTNYLKGLGSRVAAFFGLNIKSSQSKAAYRDAVSTARTRASQASTRTSGGTTTTRAPSAPTTRR